MELVIVRKATLRDAEKISDLLIKSQWFTYKKLYTATYIGKMIEDYYNVERIKDEITSINLKWHGYFVAEKNDEIIGTISGGMTQDNIGEIYAFYLNPIFIGIGIGTRLLNFYTKIQKYSYGAQEQCVAVAKGNQYGIPFYEAKGFEFQFEQVTYGASTEDDDISLIYKRTI